VATRKETLRSPGSPPDDDDDLGADPPAAQAHGSPGGDATVDEMSEWSFPASDPPSTWTWEVPAAADETRPRQEEESHP
jgi:hypothetical protein